MSELYDYSNEADKKKCLIIFISKVPIKGVSLWKKL